jgi:hypothetical protein
MAHAFDIFEDWQALISACQKPIHPANVKPMSQPSDHLNEWRGTESFTHAQEISVSGSPEMEARVKELASAFSGAFLHGARDMSGMAMVWDVAGDEPDIDRYLQGEPENMVSYVPDEKVAHGKIVTIAVNVSASHNHSPQAIERRGAAIVALIDLIEESGRRAEVFACCALENRRNSYQMKVCIKRSEAPLDMTRLVYALVHPSMLRRHILRLMESMPINWLSLQYGIPAENMARTGAGVCDLWIPGINTLPIGDSDAAARDWLIKTLRAISEGE